MDIKLWFARLGRGMGMIRCPSCRRIYDPMANVCDWGITVAKVCTEEDLSYDELMEICGCCLRNPSQIDLLRFEREHRRRGTLEEHIEIGVKLLQQLKDGKVSADQLIR